MTKSRCVQFEGAPTFSRLTSDVQRAIEFYRSTGSHLVDVKFFEDFEDKNTCFYWAILIFEAAAIDDYSQHTTPGFQSRKELSEEIEDAIKSIECDGGTIIRVCDITVDAKEFGFMARIYYSEGLPNKYNWESYLGT